MTKTIPSELTGIRRTNCGETWGVLWNPKTRIFTIWTPDEIRECLIMKNYSVEFEYKIKEYGECTVPATDPDEAEAEASKYVGEFYPDVEDITITGVREIRDNG